MLKTKQFLIEQSIKKIVINTVISIKSNTMKLNTLIVFFGFAFLVLFNSCSNQSNIKADNESIVPIVDFTSIKPLLEKGNDTTYIVNFWATWCSPCVKELPHFERLQHEYSNQKVKVILVNLDFPSHYETRLIPFLKEKDIQSEVIVLDDPDANRWINEVDPSWSGSIPATVIYKKSNRKFFEKELSYEELEETVKTIMNTI